MRTVTFYSYKGGTGRSLLLANVAMLVARLGGRVVGLDLDLEAPGLGYKLLPPGQHQVPSGALDWLAAWKRRRDRPSLVDGAIKVPVSAPFLPEGELRLIPAGAAPSGGYFKVLRDLRIDSWVDDGNGVDAFVELQEAIEAELAPEYLFIDSRTGITTTNAITTRALADAVVVLALDTPEQLEGTRAVLRTLQPLTSLRTGEPLDLHLVHARASVGPGAVDEALAEMVSFVTEPAWPASATVVLPQSHAHSVRHDSAVARREFLPLGLDRAYSGAIHDDYLGIASVLFPDLMDTTRIAAVIAAMASGERDATAVFFRHDLALIDSVAVESDSPSPRESPDLTAIQRIERARSAPVTPESLVDLATALGDKARALDELGDSDALDAWREAVEAWRAALVQSDTAAVRSGWLRDLTSCAAALDRAGRRGEALEATFELVAECRRHLDDDPSTTARLANYLGLLGIRLSELGRLAEALAATEEAVTICRELAATNPALRPDLAASVNNLGVFLSELGRFAEALAATEEAVTIYRELAATNPPLRPDLAASLTNLGVVLSELRKLAEALAATEEAVTIYRELAAALPAAFGPGLAAALAGLAQALAGMGQPSDAAGMAAESIMLYEALASTESERYTAGLKQARRLRERLLATAGNSTAPTAH